MTVQDILPEMSRKRFTDVQGCPEAKAELEEIVDYLKGPEKYASSDCLVIMQPCVTHQALQLMSFADGSASPLATSSALMSCTC